jgi:TetR/AcrR family transcriptional regulator, regulator of biofilm formation and stress response
MTDGAGTTPSVPTSEGDKHATGRLGPPSGRGRSTRTHQSPRASSDSPVLRNQQSRPRGVARREALLEAVLRIVADVGTDAVTHRRVADCAGLPLASTTYWFKSKEDLLTAAFELAADRDIDRLERFLVESHPETDPITRAVDAILGPPELSAQVSRGCLVASYALLLEAARRPILREVTRRWSEAYLSALSELLRRGGSTHPLADARLVIAAADGLLIDQLASGASRDLAPPLHRVARALVVST